MSFRETSDLKLNLSSSISPSFALLFALTSCMWSFSCDDKDLTPEHAIEDMSAGIASADLGLDLDVAGLEAGAEIVVVKSPPLHVPPLNRCG